MWVFSRGTYELTKEKKDGFYIRLASKELSAEYRMINTKGKDYLVERVDEVQTDWLKAPTMKPMLATIRDKPFNDLEWAYEVKWDGIRAIVAIDHGEMRIWSRNGKDITPQFPEVTEAIGAFGGTSLLMDGEIVCLDESGRPIFHDVIRRFQARSKSAIETGRRRMPAVFYAFDLLYLDGRSVVDDPWARRRDWLGDVLKTGENIRISEEFADGMQLFEAAKAMELEGIVAKRRDSLYEPGKRSDCWLKIKARTTLEGIILGYTTGDKGRSGDLGALHLGAYKQGTLVYIGKVGSGFDASTRSDLLKVLGGLERSSRLVEEKPLDDAKTTWVVPELVCEVRYASFIRGHLREPVFLRLRPDMSPRDCNL
jgi:DNA ligase D-like protein (predicted ligase)